MAAQPHDETMLIRYLLGRLTEEAQVQVEDRALSDPEYLAALEAAEADLIDSYVRGELSRSDRLELEQRFLTSPRRISKIEFARALAPLTAEVPPLRPAASPTRLPWTSLFANWNLGFRFAAAIAVLTVTVGVAWLVARNAALRSQIASLESRGRELQAQNEKTERLLSAERSRAESLSSGRQAPQSSGGSAPSLIASLVLFPGLARAETSQARLVIPSSAQLARIEIQLEPRDAYPRFRAELRTLGGQEVLAHGNLAPRRTAAGSSISFEVPASALSSGEYELELKGIAADRTARELGYYYFSVRKP